jgi:hypothetical protein
MEMKMKNKLKIRAISIQVFFPLEIKKREKAG